MKIVYIFRLYFIIYNFCNKKVVIFQMPVHKYYAKKNAINENESDLELDLIKY